MTDADVNVDQAKERARIAREQLVATMGEIQDRFSPQTLMQDAWRELRERGGDFADDAVEIARAKPLATGAIIAGILALAAREPLWRAASRLFFTSDETHERRGKLSRKGKADSVTDTMKEKRDDQPR